MRPLLWSLLLLSFTASGQDHYPRGLVWEDGRYDSLPLKMSYGRSADLPSAVSISAYLPKVVNQSTLFNTAVGWSLSWYGMTALVNRNTGAKTTGESGFSAAFTYRLANPGGTGCQDPVSLISGVESMVLWGVPPLSAFIDFCTDSIPRYAADSARLHRLSGFVKLFNTYDPMEFKVNAVKQALSSRNPVVAGMICPPSFALAKEFWQPHEEPDIEQGGHVICITGYNDSKYGGAFEVVNTWGKAWGVGGYTWIPYDDFFATVRYGFELFLTKGPVSGVFRILNGMRQEQTVKGNGPQYLVTSPLATGDQIQLSFVSDADVFVSVIFLDANNTLMRLFPDENRYEKLVGQVITLPGEGLYYTLTKPTGINRFLLIVSPDQYDLDLITREAETSDDLVSLLSSPTSNQNMIFDPGKVRFTTRTGMPPSPAVILVDFDQK